MTQEYIRAKPQAQPRFACPGFFSSPRASSPWLEPGETASPHGGRGLHEMFSRLVRRLKHNVPARPPIGQPACRASLTGVTDPDCQRCAFAPVLCESWIKGSLVARCRFAPRATSAPRSARALLVCIPRCWFTSEGAAHKPRYRVGSRRLRRPTRAAAGFSWTSPAASGSGSACGASIDRNPHWWLTHPLTSGS